MSDERFQDDGRRLDDFVEEVLVVCPRCGWRATVRPIEDPAVNPRSRWSLLRRVTCGHCAFTKEQSTRTVSYGVPRDPYFQLPLWLATEIDGHELWAYNADHVDHLLRCVSARLRERAPDNKRHRPQSVMERLPSWTLAGSNREVVTKALRRMLARAAVDQAAT